MADGNRKDDLADALARMAAGEVSGDGLPPVETGGLPPAASRPDAPVPKPVPTRESTDRPAESLGGGSGRKSTRPLPTVSVDPALSPDGGPAAPRPAGNAARQATELMNRLAYRRTIVPPLLVLGGLLLLTGLGVLLLGEDWVIGGLPAWLGLCLLATGALLLAVGGANAVFVRRELLGQR